jgi:hypothetical protein
MTLRRDVQLKDVILRNTTAESKVLSEGEGLRMTIKQPCPLNVILRSEATKNPYDSTDDYVETWDHIIPCTSAK